MYHIISFLTQLELNDWSDKMKILRIKPNQAEYEHFSKEYDFSNSGYKLYAIIYDESELSGNININIIDDTLFALSEFHAMHEACGEFQEANFNYSTYLILRKE